MMVCFCVLVCLFDSLNLDWHEKGARESTYSYDVCQWLHLQMHLVCTNRNVLLVCANQNVLFGVYQLECNIWCVPTRVYLVF